MAEGIPELNTEQTVENTPVKPQTPAELKRLLDERAELNARIRAAKSQAKKDARTLRNRHGILTGLAALEWMEVFPNPALAEQLQRARDWWLTKPDERALFGLPPKLELVSPRRKAKKTEPETGAAADGAPNTSGNRETASA